VIDKSRDNQRKESCKKKEAPFPDEETLPPIPEKGRGMKRYGVEKLPRERKKGDVFAKIGKQKKRGKKLASPGCPPSMKDVLRRGKKKKRSDSSIQISVSKQKREVELEGDTSLQWKKEKKTQMCARTY